MLKVNNKDTRMTPMETYSTPCSSVSIVNFEHVIAGWEQCNIAKLHNESSPKFLELFQKHIPETYSVTDLNKSAVNMQPNLNVHKMLI